jgi:hypothetical protein
LVAQKNQAGNLADELVEVVKSVQLLVESRVFFAGDGGHGAPPQNLFYTRYGCGS